jgi:hypothetical protein
VSRLLAFLLAISVLPSMGASMDDPRLEHAGEPLVQAQHEHDGTGSERGCSVLFHLCACHASASSVPAAARVEVTTAAPSDQRSPLGHLDAAPTRNADPPPLPPPIA